MTANVNMNRFYELFVDNYDLLYIHNDNIAGYGEAVEAFDRFLGAYPEFVWEFASVRKQIITSDRECAAFMFAFIDYLDEINWA